jgi:hypothetical protein
MKIRFGSILLSLALLLTTTVAMAQAPVTLSVEAGLDGHYTVGQWLPVRVLIENNGPSIDGRVEITLPRAGEGKVVNAYPVSLPTQSRKEITLYLYPETYVSNLEVALLDTTGQVITKQNTPLKSVSTGDRLYGIIADQPSAYNVLSELDPPGGVANVATLTLHDLPDRSAALDSLNTLIISNVDTGDLTAVQRAALSAWIANGGRLIVTGGPGWQKTSAGLRDLLPLSPASATPLDDLGALKTYAGSTTSPGSAIVATGTLTPDAQVILKQADTPLITRRQHGLGEVVFLGFDPANLQQVVVASSAAGGSQAWDGFLEIYRQLTQSLPDKPGWGYGVQDWYTATSAASNIPNLNLPPVSLICGFLGLYMVAIGPINYLVVRKLKRRELAWISVPLLTIGFTAAAFLAGSLLRGNQPVLNRLALVQVWPTSNQARLTGIVGLYAPQRALYEVKADQGLLLHTTTDTTPYGYGSSVDTSNWTLSSDGAAMRARVMMDVSEVKTLGAEGEVPAPQFAPDLQLVVDSAGARVSGSVTNNSDLVLQDAVLLGPGLVHQVGTVAPGESVPVDFKLDRASHSSQATTSPQYYDNSGDTTRDDILGPYNFNNSDSIRNRRYEMLGALLFGNNTPVRRGRGGGLYLVGWNDRSPVKVEVEGTPFGAFDTTLYIVDLNPTLQVMSGTLTLPPGAFTWRADNTDGTAIEPYDNVVYPGSYIFEFNLARPINYKTVKNMTLNLAGNFISSQGTTVAVWNYRANNWTPLSSAQDGDNAIPDPQDHAGPGGEIRLKIDVSSNGPVQLDRADFTLTVQ